jgi:hypothetical protein
MADQEDTKQIITIRRLRWLGMLPLLAVIVAAFSCGILLSLLGAVMGAVSGWPGGDQGFVWLLIGGVSITAASIVPLLLVIVSRLRYFWPSVIASALCVLVGLSSLIPTVLMLPLLLIEPESADLNVGLPQLILGVVLVIAGVTGLESWVQQGKNRRALRGLGMALPLAIALLIGIARVVTEVSLLQAS